MTALIRLSNLRMGGGDQTSDFDFYSDLLRTSIYRRVTYDGFADQNLINVGGTTMYWSQGGQCYTFEAGDIILSNNLVDPLCTLLNVRDVMVYMDFEDSGTPLIEVTVNGGANWEPINLLQRHAPAFLGKTMLLRYTAGGTGIIRNWGAFYEVDYFWNPGGSGGGGALRPWELLDVTNDNFDCLANWRYAFNSTGGPFSVKLPPTPNKWDEIWFADIYKQVVANPVMILRNGNLIEGVSDDVIVNNPGDFGIFVWTGNPAIGWKVLGGVN